MTEQLEQFPWTPPSSAKAPQRVKTEQERLVDAVQNYMDAIAKGYGYDSIASAVSYAEESSVSKFQQEGRMFRRWRSIVWDTCYRLLDQVEAGEIAKPDERTLIRDLIPLFDPHQLQQEIEG